MYNLLRGMALFDGRLPGTNIVVDNLGFNQPGRLYHFLTHPHMDPNHSIAGEAMLECPGPIYCSQTTRDLLIVQFPNARKKLINLEVGISHSLDLGGEVVTVTLVNANHCPGSVMFIFDGGAVGKVLHTGPHACTRRCSCKMLK